MVFFIFRTSDPCDRNQAYDKIVAVLKDDAAYGVWQGISDCPASLIERLKHYFLTYKASPGGVNVCEIPHIYDSREACESILLSAKDYHEAFR